MNEFDKANLIMMANSSMPILQAGGSDALGKLFHGADIVFALWQDRMEPDGVGVYIAKGIGRLQLISQAQNGVQQSINAVPCRNLEEAMAMSLVFGDGRSRAPSVNRKAKRRRSKTHR